MKRLSACLALALLLGCSGSKEQAPAELHLYNWNDYIAPETLQRFEAAHACKVIQDYYSGTEEMLAKLAAGATGYDVIIPTQNAVEALVRQGALAALDKSKLPALANADPVYLDRDFDPGNVYSLPYAYTTTLIGYNETRLAELGIAADDWAVIFDPVVLEQLKGKVTVMDDQLELFAAALKYLGYSVNDRDETHLQEAQAVIRAAKPFWAAFNSSSYIKELTVGNIWVAHGYSSDMFQARADAAAAGRDFSVAFALPRQGAVQALDNMVIPAGAKQPELAHAFINFMLDGANAAELSNLIGTGNPNRAALAHIKPEIAALTAIFPDSVTQSRLELLKDLNAEQRQRINRLWTEVKLD
jgi:spermidine/putrescine transport system substrate-binding protein